jgi:methyl-accepting chemotaxis protein
MEHDTQQNAALVEQTAASAAALQEQAAKLAQAVSVFRLAPATNGGTTSQGQRALPAPARRAA